jgi:apolipoprotein N-acyltransferase
MARVHDAGIGAIAPPQARPNGSAPVLSQGHVERSHAPGAQVFRAVASPPDRLSYFWLALAVALLPFTIFRWTIPLAAWLAPMFLLRFVRTQPLIRGILLALLANVLVLEFVLRGVMPIPDPFYYPAVFGVGVAITLPYLIDRVVAPRLGGLVGTMVFPAALTTMWYVQASSAAINPYAST